MSFKTRNNLYKFIRESEFDSAAKRFPFGSAEVVRDWLMWIKNNDSSLSVEDQRLLSCLIVAAKLDFESVKK